LIDDMLDFAKGRLGGGFSLDRNPYLYFPVADNALEMPHLAQAELRPIPSIWGHVAGSPPPGHADFSFLRSAVRTWLE
jgi:hypothetical protein